MEMIYSCGLLFSVGIFCGKKGGEKWYIYTLYMPDIMCTILHLFGIYACLSVVEFILQLFQVFRGCCDWCCNIL